MASAVKVSKLNFELNPRGNLWFNDESTFGHKLLSKMGWSKGKGLGKNENGIKENIKISKKGTNTGVGWKNDVIPVAVGCLEYEDILQNLQKHFNKKPKKQTSEENFERSLEKRSRSARNHLHYQKFVRGKDLIRYSEKDMKSIFLEKPQKPVSDHPSHTPNETPTFSSQLSVNDYFALKMQKKKENAAKSNIIAENISEQSQPLSARPSKKRKLVSVSPEIETSRKAKLKRKDLDSGIFNSTLKEDIVIESCPESTEISKRKKKKKSKKSKSHLQKLKSCLKSRTDYDFEKTRNVSFNQQVSYKILDTSLESCEEINDLSSNDRSMDEVEDKQSKTPTDSDEETEVNETDGMRSSDEVSFVSEEDRLGNEDGSFTNNEDGFTNKEDSCTKEEEGECDDLRTPPCFDLPKCSSSNFNFWLDSQRQASKMEIYKQMAKKIKKDKFLRSTNLLDIKGYGNWKL